MRLESRRENSDPGESQEIASRFRALASNGCVPRLSAQPQTNATLRAFSGPIGRTQIFGFTVEQTPAGQTDGIEELVLGTEVFDRPPDFKPQVDTIVRVAVGAWGVWRLRTPVAPVNASIAVLPSREPAADRWSGGPAEARTTDAESFQISQYGATSRLLAVVAGYAVSR